MENRLRSASKGNAISSLSLSVGDHRGCYYSLSSNDTKSLRSSSDNCAAITTNSTTFGTSCMFINGHRSQQRYKLITSGVVQMCRVPHAKNIIEKIRFSYFLRRWKDHHIDLEHSEISSKTVSFICFHPHVMETSFFIYYTE